MFPLESLTKFQESLDYIDLNNKEEVKKLKRECDKLVYLQTYPDNVRTRISELDAEIRSFKIALEVDINSQKSTLEQIKRRQVLEPRYKELSEMINKLRKLKEELNYAEHVKAVAVVRLQLYKELLSKNEEGVTDDGDDTDTV